MGEYKKVHKMQPSSNPEELDHKKEELPPLKVKKGEKELSLHDDRSPKDQPMTGAFVPSLKKALKGPALASIASILFLCLGSLPLRVNAQSAQVINDGAQIVTEAGATVYTQGEVRNRVNGGNNGVITNDGTILTTHSNPSNASYYNLNADAITQGNGTFEIEGDWVNSAIFNGDNGEVVLYGPDQMITGDSVSTFNDLTLTGTGTKTLDLDAEVTGIMDLTDRRLHTDTNSMFVLNTAPGAIVRTPGLNNTVQGFVSSDSTGWLVREMNQTSSYLFPVGDSAGTPRFRPADLTPSNTNPQTLRARLKNSDPTPDGYDVTNKAAGVGPVNPNFYWHIDRPSGSDPLNVELFYDEAVDTADMAVHWDAQWEMMGPATNNMNGSPQLSSVAHSGWNTFTPDPFDIAANPFSVNAGNDTTICVGDTAQLDANVNGGTGPFGFTWTPSTYLNDSTLQDPEAQGVMDTIKYYVTAYDSATGTTSQPDSMTVFVEPKPDDTISPANPATCPGDSVLLEANGSASSYSWSPDSTLTSNTGDTTYSVPDDDETIVLTATNALGCIGTDTVDISVQSAPGEPVGSASPDTICEGDSTTITATGSGPGVTYEVYDSATGGTYLGDTPLDVAPTSDSSFYIKATLTGSGCSYPGDRDTVSVTVQSAPSAPTVSLSPDTLCLGDSTTLSASGSGAGTIYEVYDDSTGGTYLGDASLDLGPDSTTVYYVQAVDTNGCSPVSGRVADTVHVDSLPDMSVSPSAPTICQGDSVELVASGADTYNWAPNVDIDTTTGDTVQAYPNSDTTYTVTGTDTNGCVNDTSVTVSVDSAPTQPTVDITPDTICQGDSATITASGSGGSVVYEVYDDSTGGNYLGNTPLTVGPMNDSVYYVEATLPGGGCSYGGGRVGDTLTVESATPDPTLSAMPDTVCPGDSSVIDATGSGAGVTYEVYGDPSGVPYIGDAPVTVGVDSTSEFYVSAVGSNGCDQLDGPDTITVHTYPEPNANAGPDLTSCPGDTIPLTASGGNSYTWSTGDSGDSISVAPDSTTTYWVEAQNTQGCTDRDSVTVNVVTPGSFTAVDDKDTVIVDKNVVIDVFANDTGSIGDSAIISGPYQGTASWVNGGIDYAAPSDTGKDSLTYVVCSFTCSNICDTAVVDITIEEGIPELFIPNGISADGDGMNDVWEIQGLEAYPENSVKIFNRWGEEVYSADPYENDWKGQSKTGEVLEGTYFYVLNLGPDKEKKTGFIELRR